MGKSLFFTKSRNTDPVDAFKYSFPTMDEIKMDFKVGSDLQWAINDVLWLSPTQKKQEDEEKQDLYMDFEVLQSQLNQLKETMTKANVEISPIDWGILKLVNQAKLNHLGRNAAALEWNKIKIEILYRQKVYQRSLSISYNQ